MTRRSSHDPAAGWPKGVGARSGRRPLCVLLLGALTVLAVVALTSPDSTRATFTATIANGIGTAESAAQDCRFAVTSIAASDPAAVFTAYALSGTSASSETDFSGSGRDGIWRNPPTTSTSVACTHDSPAQSVTFDGSQRLSAPPLIRTPDTFSIEVWSSTTTAPNGRLAGFGDDLDPAREGSYDRHIFMDASGRLYFGISDGGFVVIATPAGTSYADGRWHAVVATLSSAGMRFFVDGSVVGKRTNTSAAGYNGYGKFGCGKTRYWPNTPSNAPRFFTGRLQYGAVYTRALSATEVENHWLAGRW